MIAPIGAATFAEALQQGAEVYHALKAVLKKKGLATGLGDEGGFAPDLSSNRAALDLIAEAVKSAGLKLGKDIALALDVAASEFHDKKKYAFEGKKKSADEMIGLLRRARRGVPDRLHRGPAGRGRLVRLEDPHRPARRQDPDRRRRPVRHQRGAPRPRHRRSSPPTPCWSRSTRSARSPRPSTRSTSRTATASAA